MMWTRRGLGLALLLAVAGAQAAESLLSPSRLLRAAVRHERVRDYPRAFRLYCLGAALDDPRAMYHLGWMNFNGRGLGRERGIAVGWFRRAAVRGERHALRMVGKLRDVPPRGDPRCPVTRDPKRMTKTTVIAWARLLGTEFGVDPRLVLAVIEAESDFNPSALSPRLAYGLMQLMPATARRFAVNRLHPVENMIGGVLYLRWLLRHFNGDVRLTLAAYNAGEQVVHRHRGVPPYQETRRYVRKIIATYRRSRHPVPKPLRL